MRKQRPVQIVGDDDRVEALRPPSGHGAAFEIGAHVVDSRRRRRARPAPAASRSTATHVAAARGEEAAVPAVSASDIEHARARRDQRCEAHDPGRWRASGAACARALRSSLDAPARLACRLGVPAARGRVAPSAAASSISQSTNACASGRDAACGAANDEVGARRRVAFRETARPACRCASRLSISGTRPSATPWPSSAAWIT